MRLFPGSSEDLGVRLCQRHVCQVLGWTALAEPPMQLHNALTRPRIYELVQGVGVHGAIEGVKALAQCLAQVALFGKETLQPLAIQGFPVAFKNAQHRTNTQTIGLYCETDATVAA